MFFTKDVYDNIYPCRSKPARIYGIPKTQKFKSKTNNFTPYSSFHRYLQLQTSKTSWRTIELNYSIETLCYRFFSFSKEIREVSAYNKFMVTKLFDFATSGTHFLFNGNYYDQVDGVAMGSLFIGTCLSQPVCGITWKDLVRGI